MSLALDIADAVTAEINAANLLPAVSAVRRVLPEFELKDLAELKVTVVPRSVNITGAPNGPKGRPLLVKNGVCCW